MPQHDGEQAISLCSVLRAPRHLEENPYEMQLARKVSDSQPHLGLLAKALQVPGAHLLVDVLLARLPPHHLATAGDLVPLGCRLREGQDCSLGLETVQRQLQWTMMLDVGSPHKATGVAVQLSALLVTNALQQQWAWTQREMLVSSQPCKPHLPRLQLVLGLNDQSCWGWLHLHSHTTSDQAPEPNQVGQSNTAPRC
jgi:hypothetical protein